MPFSYLLKLIFLQLTWSFMQSKLVEFCERWWQCTQELQAVEEHCEQKHAFPVKQRPWWAFKISGRKITDGTECDQGLKPSYSKLNKLYAKFDDEVHECLGNISKTVQPEHNVGCQIISDGVSDRSSESDESPEACWSQVHQIHAKCNILKVCCTPASWCLREVGKRSLGKAIEDFEDDITRQRVLCERKTGNPEQNPEEEQMDNQTRSTTKGLKIAEAESVDEQSVSVPQQSLITSDQQQQQIAGWSIAGKTSLLTNKSSASLNFNKTLQKVAREYEAVSFCGAYVECQRNLLHLNDACAVASGKIHSGTQYDYSPFYRLVEPVDDVDRNCRQQENGRQMALDIARDQTIGYIRWCIRIQAPKIVAHIPRSCYAANMSYHGRIARLRQQLVQADNCATHMEHFSNICQRLRKCCLPAESCEKMEEFKGAVATYTDLMVDLKAFMNSCYHDALTGSVLRNGDLEKKH